MTGTSIKNSPRTPTRSEFLGNSNINGMNSPRLLALVSPTSAGRLSDNIKVICRVRPLLEDDSNIIICDESTVTVKGKDSTSFTFDKIFYQNSVQQEIYDYSITQTVDDAFNGYNGTILAYGQTGLGKSYTMLGPSVETESKGVIPRLVDNIFHKIRLGSSNIEYTVNVLVMEIYLEKINDLLITDNKNLVIHEDKHRGIYVGGLSNVFVDSDEDLYDVITLALRNRTSNVTNMNLESSRSHAIFQIKLNQKDLSNQLIKLSTLFLIDLAGSEKIDKTGAIGQTLQEAKNINSSLSALGNVINALSNDKSSHIPYRDSKLTRILQESLGGNSRTTLILNISPNSSNELETLSTLRFGSRAKHIKNKPYINTELSTHELKFRLKQLERTEAQHLLYIEKLETQIISSGGKLPLTSFKSDSGIVNSVTSTAGPASEEKDALIKQLQDEILSHKIKTLEISNDEEIKLNKLERALNKLNEKLNDVEIINVNLRKHLMINEKLIDQKDSTILYLYKLLGDQKLSLTNQSLEFQQRLNILRSKVGEIPSSPQGSNVHKASPKIIDTPKGIDLKIIRPIVGGDLSDDEDPTL